MRITRVPEVVRERKSGLDPMDRMFSAVDEFFEGVLPGFFDKGRERDKELYYEAVLSPDGLTIRIRTNGLRSVVAELRDGAGGTATDDAETLDVHVTMQLRRRGGRKEIILPESASPPEERKAPPSPIARALARAYRWQAMLDTREAESIDALAKRQKVDASYVRRMLDLATLAPEIVEAVLAGDGPDGLSLRRLAKGVPLLWAEQCRAMRPGGE